MKKITSISRLTPILDIQLLNSNELLSIRGGIGPLKPKSRPREIYDDEKED